MCVKAPKVQPAPAPPAVESTDTAATTAAENERRRRAQLAGRAGTVLTGAQGVQPPAAAGVRTLLGG